MNGAWVLIGIVVAIAAGVVVWAKWGR